MFRRRRKSARMVAWTMLDCSGCGLPVAFLPKQILNTCAWCGTAVMSRGLEQSEHH